MDEFSYLSVLLSIILGLSLTQLLQGLSGAIQYRQRIRLFAPSIIWAVLLLLIDTQAWWAMFGLRIHHSWTFLQFTIVLLETILLYLLAALVLPRFEGESAIDLRENYFGHSRWFFSCLIAVLLVSLSKDFVLAGQWPSTPNLAFHLVWIVGGVCALLSRSDSFHRWFSILSAVTFTAYIGLLFRQLPHGD